MLPHYLCEGIPIGNLQKLAKDICSARESVGRTVPHCEGSVGWRKAWGTKLPRTETNFERPHFRIQRHLHPLQRARQDPRQVMACWIHCRQDHFDHGARKANRSLRHKVAASQCTIAYQGFLQQRKHFRSNGPVSRCRLNGGTNTPVRGPRPDLDYFDRGKPLPNPDKSLISGLCQGKILTKS
mgnify:CR=1 FL=1